MEERIMDDEGRLIRLKKTAMGTDAVEDNGDVPEGSGEIEDELVLEIPETDEYDDDLVGLTPSQLREALDKRERARREAEEEGAKLAQEGQALLEEEKFEEAEEKFSSALSCDSENEEAGRGIWLARTKNFTDLSSLLEEENYLSLAGEEKQRAFILERAGDRLRDMREECEQEEKELAPVVESAMEERRKSFSANKKYYLVRFLGVFGAFVLAVIAIAVSGSFLYKTTSMAPILCIAVFGGVALFFLVLTVLYTRKLLVASRLCRENENLLSTEKGTRLYHLREQKEAFSYLFGETEETEEDEEPEVGDTDEQA